MQALGIDPGREKVGLALVASDGQLLRRLILPPLELANLDRHLAGWDFAVVFLGHATGHEQARNSLEELMENGKLPARPVVVINEKGSTLEARSLYWQAHPPRGWRKLVPLALQVPPDVLDDFAAAVIALRGLKQQGS
jgi:RNase H-fold protein (predicted Holliday junction resolvase)